MMERRHTIVLSAGANTAEQLAAELRALADRLAAGDVADGRSARVATAVAELKFVYVCRPEPADADCLPGADAWP